MRRSSDARGHQSHFAAGGHWCHGTPAAMHLSGAGTAGHGIETAGPMVPRAVVLDMAGWMGVPCLDAGTAITAAMLQGAARVRLCCAAPA